MARYEILGGAALNGEVTVSGAKNAVVAILPAALLVNGPCRIENVPDISDVRILLGILQGMGATIEKPEPGVVVIDCSGVTETNPDAEVKTARAEGLRECRKLMTLAKAGKYNGYLLEGMACPGGCVAGAGTLLPVELAANVVGRYQKEADQSSPLESTYRDRSGSLD